MDEQRKTRTRTDEERARDDQALLASGEPLATMAELAVLLGVNASSIRYVMRRADASPVRSVRATPESPARFSVSDVRAVVDPHRKSLEERRRRAEALEAEERAAARAKKAARAIAHAAHVAAKVARSKGGPASNRRAKSPPPAGSGAAPPPVPSRRKGAEPEIIVMRRRPGPTA
jgi:hypothetical protein